MRITALAGGVGGARFLRGLRDHLDATGRHDVDLTVIGNTGDDITLFGLRVCPDLDTLAYTLGDAVHEQQGWGRADEHFTLAEEFAAFRAEPDWFTLGDRDLALHVLRSQWLGHGMSLSAVTERVAQRFGLPERRISLLPMSDQPVETHVVVERADGPQAVHFQEWWVRERAAVPAQRFVAVGMERATAAPGVLDALRSADLILLPPSNPIVSIGIILLVPGVRDALRGAVAPVVGVSPIVGGAPVRGHADACLAPLGIPVTPSGVAGLYADFLDGWLIDSGEDAEQDRVAEGGRYAVARTDLLMPDRPAAARLAGATLDLALSLRGGRSA